MTNRLEEMADGAASAWPHLPGWVIDKAVQFVCDRKVKPLGSLPKSGIDEWDVDGVHCSHRGQQCQCREKGAMTKIGKVCSHRLAVMFRIRLDDGVLGDLADAYANAPDDVRIVLMADVYYGSGPVGGTRWLLKGWRVNGHGTTMLSYDDRVELTEDRIGGILRSAGWMMTDKAKQGGFTYHAYTVRMDQHHEQLDPDMDVGVGRMRGWTQESKEAKENREKMGFLFRSELDRNAREAAA